MFYVVDTNVPLVANKKADHASETCVENCVHFILKIVKEGKIAIDDHRLILNEYKKQLHSSGQPGVGDAFLKWVLTNSVNEKKVSIVSVSPTDSYASDFEEFPDDKRLRSFDSDDKKFVVVSMNHPDHPQIAEAVDPIFWLKNDILREYGVDVLFLCEEDISRTEIQQS